MSAQIRACGLTHEIETAENADLRGTNAPPSKPNLVLSPRFSVIRGLASAGNGAVLSRPARRAPLRRYFRQEFMRQTSERPYFDGRTSCFNKLAGMAAKCGSR